MEQEFYKDLWGGVYIMEKERGSIFIDGSNLYHSLKRLGVDIGFDKLIMDLVGERFLVNVFYYIAPLNMAFNPEKYWKHQKFLERLRKIPKFNVVLYTLRKIRERDGEVRFEVKGDLRLREI